MLAWTKAWWVVDNHHHHHHDLLVVKWIRMKVCHFKTFLINNWHRRKDLAERCLCVILVVAAMYWFWNTCCSGACSLSSKVWLQIAWLGFNCLRGAGKFSFHQHVRDGLGMYLPSCSMGTRWWRSFLRGKRIQNVKLVLRSENMLSIPYMPLVHTGSMLLGTLVLCCHLNLVDLVNRMSWCPFTWISVVG